MHNDNTAPGKFTAPGEVRFVRILPGPIERVWEYLTDAKKRATWFAGGPMDLRVGGQAQLVFRHKSLAPNETPPAPYEKWHDPGATVTQHITRCEPPRLLAFTFGEKPDGSDGEVIFELTPQGENVQLVLTHRRAADRRDLTQVSAGWHTHLALLVARLQGTPPPPFWAPLLAREADYEKRFEAAP